MPDLSSITNAELMFDRQECYNDILMCLLATVMGAADERERMSKNMEMLNTITRECKRRGFDPAQFPTPA